MVIVSINLLTKSTLPEAQFGVHQFTQFNSYTNILHDQAVKFFLKYLKGAATQDVILEPNPEKGIECYIDADFSGGWNQDEGADPQIVPICNGLHHFVRKLSNHMGDLATNINSTQHYGGVIYRPLSIH